MRFWDWIYFSFLFLSAALCIYHWVCMSRADKLIAFLVVGTFIAELVAFELKSIGRDNQLVYRLFGPFQLCVLSVYFDTTVRALRRFYIAGVIGVLSLILFFVNGLFPVMKIADFLLFESTIVIIYCLFSIRQILLETDLMPFRFAHFWFTSAFLVYWSLTFTGWGVTTITEFHNEKLARMFFWLLLATTYGFNVAITLILLYYKKLIPSGE